MDLALDDATGDLKLENGDLALVRRADAVAQFVGQRLRFFLGEWFLDETKGLPYFDLMFVKNPNPVAINSVWKKEIIDTPGMVELSSFNLDVDFRTRAAELTFEGRSADGEISFSGAVGEL